MLRLRENPLNLIRIMPARGKWPERVLSEAEPVGFRFFCLRDGFLECWMTG